MTKKRYCDFCKSEIKQGESFIKLVKTDYKERKIKSKYSDKIINHQIYPQKVIGDMCDKCFNKLKDKSDDILQENIEEMKKQLKEKKYYGR
jgi:hypothetical protein